MKSYIPTVNISSLLKSDFNSLSAKNTLLKIERACVKVGFFQVKSPIASVEVRDKEGFEG